MDYDYLPASNGSGDPPLMHVTATRLTGATTLQVDTITNVPAKFIATYGVLGSDGLITAASARNFKGHTSGADLIIDAFEPGSTDAGNAIGDIVVIKPTTGWADRIAQFIKDMTNFGTPENIWASAISAVSAALSGALSAASGTFSGNVDVTGNVSVSGTSRLIPATVVTSDGSNNLTPTKQLFSVTALAHDATILVPTWATSNDMMSGLIKIKDNGTARALTFGTGWATGGPTLPTTTVVNKWLRISYEWSSQDSKWFVTGIAREP